MIGVAVSTHQRPGTLARSLEGWAGAMPDILVVNHDVTGTGVAATKNRGITALMDAGCDHLFLADDDMYPVRARWWEPYLRSPEPHLMHCWGSSRYLRTNADYADSDETVTVWRWPRGVLLYVRREVVNVVGGMREEFGRWGGEHAEWSRRIHNAGFTRAPFQDAGTARVGTWHCEDYTRSTPSTITDRERAANTTHRHELYDRYRHSRDFVEFRGDRR